MSDRRGPPPPRDYDPYPPGPPRDYERPPPTGDYRRPPPFQPRSPPRFDARRGPPPPRDGYDDYRGPPPPARLRSPEPGFDGRAKRRRSLSPGPPPRRGGGDYYEPREYPPRDGHYRAGPPPIASNYRDYPPGPPPLAGRAPRGPPGPPLRGGPPEEFHRGPPLPAYYPPPPHATAREPKAPHHLPYIVTHRYFSDWFTRTNPPALADSPEALELAWKKYLAEYMRRSLRPQFEELRGMKWFEEKYGVGEEREGEREKRKEEGRKGRVAEWCDAMERGEWENVTSEFDEEALASPNASDQNGDTKMTESTDADKEKKDEDKKEKPKKPQPSLGDGLIPLTPETVLIPSRPNRIIVDSIPSHIAYSQLYEVFSTLEGFERLSTGDGQPFANWVRTGWVNFDSEENATKALESLNDISIEDYKLSLRRQDQPVEIKIRAAPAAMSAPDRLKKDLATVESIIEYLEKEEKKDMQEEEVKMGSELIRAMKERWEKEVEEKKEKGEDVTKDEVEVVRKTLDYSLHYLRFAFHTCYYCATQCQSAEALESVCARHVRRIGAPLPSDLTFVKGLDEKLPLLDDHEKLDLRDFGAELKEDLCQPHIKIEEEGKFRCKECNKLFSARKFVEKHILTKHGHFVNDAIKQVEFFNNFILDPAHHPIADFQRMNFLPSLLNPPPPAPTLADRIGGRRAPTANGSDNKRQKREGNPPPPPKGATLDPRAARVPSSYADLDGQPGGAPDVVELPY